VCSLFSKLQKQQTAKQLISSESRSPLKNVTFMETVQINGACGGASYPVLPSTTVPLTVCCVCCLLFSEFRTRTRGGQTEESATLSHHPKAARPREEARPAARSSASSPLHTARWPGRREKAGRGRSRNEDRTTECTALKVADGRARRPPQVRQPPVLAKGAAARAPCTRHLREVGRRRPFGAGSATQTPQQSAASSP
jgi:hypothetical protein